MKNSRCIVAVLIIILSTFVLETQGSTCTATGITQDFIQTGIVAFSTSSTSPSTSLITGSPNREYCGQVTVQFRPTSVGLSWLFAISDFGTFSPSTSGSDYSVSGKASTTSTTIVIVTLLIGGSWTNILVSYLIESRTDLYTGTFLVGGASTFDCQQSGDQVVMGSYVIPNWTPITQADVLFKQIFVSGIRTQTQALSLSLNPTFNPSTGVFTVTINLGVNSFV